LSIKFAEIIKRKLIGQILIEKGLVNEEELRTALNVQKSTREKLGRILVDLGYLSEKDLLAALSEQLNIPVMSAQEFPEVPAMENTFSHRFLKQCKFVPVAISDNQLTIAMADPLDSPTLEAIRQHTGYDIRVYMAAESEILDLVEKFYGSSSSSFGRIIEGIGEGDMDALSDDMIEDVEHLKDMASEAPVIRLVNLVISKAIEGRASDVHIEPFEKDLKVRYRIDGILHDVESPPKKLKAAIISRVKIMAKLNIAERRVPQDGRIKLKVLGRDVDLRVSTLPTMYGESVVMRILDKSNSNLYELTRLGFPEDSLEQMESLITRPHGIFLVTGPTGSGKTTTLYSALRKINLPDKKIITVEDPVEYQMDGVNQIQVNPQIGLTFATGLRHIVRQDPDVIMIGEIRDLETAEIAIRAALTGHLVFSTLHTNDAPGAITRLVDMGAEDYLIASSLLGVLAQRLVRVICPQCKAPAVPDDKTLQEMALIGERKPRDMVAYEGQGCSRCGNTGYVGRIGIYELMLINDDIRRLTIKKADSNTLKQAAIKNGMRALRLDGWIKVLDGVTSISEVMRVTQDA
jgi:general secretion pathway protein E